jgi:hypothetical protein
MLRLRSDRLVSSLSWIDWCNARHNQCAEQEELRFLFYRKLGIDSYTD